MPIPVPKTRRNLSADGLHRTLRDSFEQIPDHRPQPDIPLRDALLSGFALFSLKDPSLLAFDARRREGNLHRLCSCLFCAPGMTVSVHPDLMPRRRDAMLTRDACFPFTRLNYGKSRRVVSRIVSVA